jgi:integrase
LKRRERPLKRKNPSGEIVWVARYTNSAGKRKSAGTFKLRGPCQKDKPGSAPTCCAQHAIDAAYGLPERTDTIGAYAQTWPERHPRSERTITSSYLPRLRAILDVEVEGRPLRHWPYGELRRRHMVALVDHMLRVEGRAVTGAIGIRNVLSTMTEDAITDEVAEVNFAKGVKIRANDPRVKKAPRKIQVWTFDQLREFALAGQPEVRAQTPKPEPHGKTGETFYYPPIDYEPMLTVFGLTNLRIGEVFALLRAKLEIEELLLHVTGTAHNGVITEGDSREKKHVRAVPLAPSAAEILRRLPPRIDTRLLFPTRKGTVWHYSTFIRDVWLPAQIASELPIKPHECRHSYVTNLRAAGVDPADLAEITGHDIETATRAYHHPLGQSMELIREVIG